MTKRKKIILLIIISVIIIPTILIVIAPMVFSSVYVFLGKTLCSLDKSSCAIFASGVSIFLDKTQYTPGSEIKITVMNTGLKPAFFYHPRPLVHFYSIDQQRHIHVGTDQWTTGNEWTLYPGMLYSYNELLIEYHDSPSHSNPVNLPSGAYEVSLSYSAVADGQLKGFGTTQTFQIVDE